MKWLVLVAGAVVLVGCGSSEQDLKADREDAARVCHGAVEKTLKSPGTAKYSGEVMTGDPKKSMTVTGNVDSQNSLGGVVRNTWTCTVHAVGDEWRANASLTSAN